MKEVVPERHLGRGRRRTEKIACLGTKQFSDEGMTPWPSARGVGECLVQRCVSKVGSPQEADAEAMLRIQRVTGRNTYEKKRGSRIGKAVKPQYGLDKTGSTGTMAC